MYIPPMVKSLNNVISMNHDNNHNMSKKSYSTPLTFVQSLEGILLWAPQAGSEGGGMPNPAPHRRTEVF